jgi:hypothetical protein
VAKAATVSAMAQATVAQVVVAVAVVQALFLATTAVLVAV